MGVYLKTRKDGTKAWFYDFMHNKVRYRGVGGTTKTQALRTLDKVRNQILSGDFDLEEKKGDVLFEKFAELYLSRRTHLRSRDRDELSTKHLVGFFKGKVLAGITPSLIEDYIAARRSKEISNSTINRELTALRRMFNLAIKWKMARRNPMDQIDKLEEPPGRTRFLTEEECKRLLDSCSKAFRPIVFTALNTGMRLREILNLKWENVYIDSVVDPYIELDRTKNNKKRFIPLNDGMVNLLRSIPRNETNNVFLGELGKPLKSIDSPYRTALQKAGITDFRFHDLRHTFASHFVMRGGDLFTLKEILGHSSMEMVMRYAHLAAAHKRKLINNLNDIFQDCHPIATSANSQ